MSCSLGPITDGVNKAHAEAEKASLGALGLGNLA